MSVPFIYTFVPVLQYRQIAPETVDDQRLRSIIKNNNNDHNAIVAAIENIWHGMSMRFRLPYFFLRS